MSVGDRPFRRARQASGGVLAPVSMGSVLVLPSIVWIALDRDVWPWDQAWYAEVTLDLWSTLSDASSAWPDEMQHAFGSKPPGVAWLGQFFVPLGPLIGDDRALLVSIVLCQMASIGLLVVLGRRLGAGTLATVAGTMLLGTAPLFVWITHEYFAEPLQTVTVIWSLLLLVLVCRTTDPIVIVSQLPGLLAVAMLAKLSSPLYLVLPIAVTGLVAATRIAAPGYERRAALRNPRSVLAGLGSTGAVVAAIHWYRANVDEALDHARQAADDGLYGTERSFPRELSEWVDRMIDSTFLPLIGLALAVVVLLALLTRIGQRSVRTPRHMLLVAAVCGAEVVLVVCVFATQSNEEARFLLPAVPFIAVLTMIAFSGVPRPLVMSGIAILTIQFGLVAAQSFSARAAVERLTYYRLEPPKRDQSLRLELERLADMTCTSSSAGRLSIVGAEHAWFNANTLAMIASARNSSIEQKCYYTSLGYAEARVESAWKRIADLNPAYFITIDYGSSKNVLFASVRAEAATGNAFNRVNRAVLERVRRDSRFTMVPSSRGHGFVVFEYAGDSP